MQHFIADGASARLTITDREQREKFFALSVDLLCVASADGYFQDLSPSWERSLGYTLNELRAEPLLSFVHPDDRETTLRSIEHQGKGQNVTSFTNRYRRKDGTYAHLEWSSTATRDGTIYALARDVTEREEAEAALRSAHARLQHLIQSGRVVLFALDPANELRPNFFSDNVEQEFGYPSSQFIHAPEFWVDRLHPDDRERVIAEIERILDQDRMSHEYRWRRKDGVYRWVHGDCRVLRGIDGQPVEVVGTWQDVTERRVADETIRQQATALLELSTPLIPISDDILVMPLIGVVDSRRAAQVLETLLEGISQRGARVAILDITGVGVVDTKVADTLLRIARAVQLVGSEIVLTGIRPDVAQTLVGLGANLGGIVTRGTLQGGIRYAMQPSAGRPRR